MAENNFGFGSLATKKSTSSMSAHEKHRAHLIRKNRKARSKSKTAQTLRRVLAPGAPPSARTFAKGMTGKSNKGGGPRDTGLTRPATLTSRVGSGSSLKRNSSDSGNKNQGLKNLVSKEEKQRIFRQEWENASNNTGADYKTINLNTRNKIKLREAARRKTLTSIVSRKSRMQDTNKMKRNMTKGS